jgi:hypothetical protein
LFLSSEIGRLPYNKILSFLEVSIMKRYIIFAVAVVAMLSLTLCVFAQLAIDQPANSRGMGRGQGMGEMEVRGEGGARGGRGGGRRRGRGEAVPVPETGFVRIFDGKTLDGWEGTDRWKVEKGTIVAQTTAENKIHSSSGEAASRRILS